MASQDTAMEEILWRSPPHVQMMGGYIHSITNLSSYDPLQAAARTDARFAHEPSTVWVIPKQNRRKRNGMDDEVVVDLDYFLVGDCIYMAPSVASVLSAVTSLSRLMKTAPPFGPSPLLADIPPTHGAGHQSPAPGGIQQSKENTPMPEAAPPSTSDTQATSSAGLGISTRTPATTMPGGLAESFSLFTKYGDRFMDETPLK
ncbi:RNA polymerase II transcription mediator complex subunit (Med6) [Penicillium verhagenii]|nr:RNA polymerase II transcription mediator complex subunit (Med6) [Penicillium verhagenii]